MTAPMISQRETPGKRYSVGPLTKVTRTVPVNGLPVTLRAAVLNLELIGRRIIWLGRLVLLNSRRSAGHLTGARCHLVNCHTLGGLADLDLL